VPERVTADPPGERLWLPIAKGAVVKACPPTVKTGFGAADVRGIVEVPICNPEEPKDITVPESVTLGPPSVRAWLPIVNPLGAAVKAWPPTIKTEAGDVDGRSIVEVHHSARKNNG